MRAKSEYRDRDKTEVAVLDALAERDGGGMTVLAIRTAVDADIDSLEDALSNLKSDELIEVSTESGRTVITVEEFVIGPGESETEADIFEQLRDRFSL